MTKLSGDGYLSEKERLLKECVEHPSNAEDNYSYQENNEENTNGSISVTKFYFTMGTIFILFVGSLDMGYNTMKQYVYAWSLNETKSNFGHVNSSDSNATDNCGHKGSKETESEAQKMAADWEIYYNLLYAVLVFFTVSTFGTLTDHIGRKPFLLLGLFGCGVRYGIIAIVINFDLHIAWILLAFGLDGLSGSGYMISLVAYASTADLTRQSGSRIFGIALMESLNGVGRLLTHFGTGYFIQKYGFFYPVLTSSALLVCTVLIAAVTFKETHKIESEMDRIEERPKTCLSCSEIFTRYTSFYIRKRTTSERKIFWLVLIVFIIYELGTQGRSDPLTLYQLGSPFCWTPELIGWYNATLAAATYVIGLLILKPLQWFLTPEVIACIGFLTSIAFSAITGLVHQTLWLFLAICFGLPMLLPKPVLRGLASLKASEKTQGAMFASLQSSELICKIASSPACLSIYTATVDTMKGFVFVVIAGLNGVGLIFMGVLGYVLRQQTDGRSVHVIQDTS